MEIKKKRLTLDIDPAVQQRLKDMAALKGVSMRGYCEAAIDRELTKDEANGVGKVPAKKPDFERLNELREEIFGGKVLPGNSVDIIREARDIRAEESKDW